MRHRPLPPVALALLATTATATGQYFAERQMSPFTPPPTGPIRIAMDVDGDGRVDLLTGTSTIDFYRNEGPHNFVLRNDGNWSFVDVSASRAPGLFSFDAP